MKENEKRKSFAIEIKDESVVMENGEPVVVFNEPAEGYVFFCAMAVSLIFAVVSGHFGKYIPELGGLRDLLLKAAYYGIWLAGIVFFTKREKKKSPDLMGFKDPYPYEVPEKKKMTVKTAVISMAALCAAQTIAFICRLAYPSGSTEEEAFTPLLLVVSLILAPVFEELIFRGFLQKNLRKYGDQTAILITAMTFGLAHSGVSGIVNGFLGGLIMGYLAMNYGLGWSMAAHFAANVPPALEKVFSDVTLNFAIGKHIFILSVDTILLYAEGFTAIVLTLWLLLKINFGKEKGSDRSFEDSPRAPIWVSDALAIPLAMAGIYIFMDALQVLL